MVSLPFLITLSLLSHPIIPCCYVPPLLPLSKVLLLVLWNYLLFLFTPCRCFLCHILHHYPHFYTSPFCPFSLLLFFFSIFFPSPPLPFLCFNNAHLTYLLFITGLWGRWLSLHHQGDNNPHGELQLPCLRLRGPVSDTCAAGEWSVVTYFLFTAVGLLLTNVLVWFALKIKNKSSLFKFYLNKQRKILYPKNTQYAAVSTLY